MKKIISVFLIIVHFLCFRAFCEIKTEDMSDGTHYKYYVPDKPTTPPPSTPPSTPPENDDPGSDDDEKNPPDGNGGGSGGGSSGGNSAIAEAERRAAEAELAQEEVLKEYKKLHAEFLEAEAEAKNIYQNRYDRFPVIMENYAEKREAFKKAEAELKEKCEAMIDSYKILGETYEKYCYAGDPVRVGTGDYICEYVDYAAQDYLKGFAVKRNLTNTDVVESFGMGWHCSLDSRIVRCNYAEWDTYIEELDSCIAMLDKMAEKIDAYNSRYKKYPSKKLEECQAELEEDYSNMELQKKIAEERIQTRKKILESNKYVTYGRYKNLESHLGYEDYLKYLDENGNEYEFIYQKSGVWKSVAQISAENLYLISRSDGGYDLYYSDGFKRQFSAYGILEKETDRNGNVTEYISNNGVIVRVKTKTGEIININRDKTGKITSIEGEVSGTAWYFYSGNRLTGVIDNSGIGVRFSYDSDNYLSKITKADGNYTIINYDDNSAFAKKVCSSVENQTGEKEEFSWNAKNSYMKHKDYAGKDEYYFYNKNGNPVYIIDSCNNKILLEVDEKGLILSATENNHKKKFSYDDKFRLSKINYGNSAEVSFEYNPFGQITGMTDSDGFTKKYLYDSKGNLVAVQFMEKLVETYSYYPSGLIKKSYINGIYNEYEYNAYGSMTKKKTYGNDNLNYTETWNYDDKNRLIKYVDGAGNVVETSYELLTKTELYNKRRVDVTKYDLRNREIEWTSTDLVLKKQIKKKVEYDAYDRIQKIYVNDCLVEEFDYKWNGSLKSKIQWALSAADDITGRQGIKTDYTYDKNGFLISEKKSVLKDEKLKNKKFPFDDKSFTYLTIKYKEIDSDTEVTVTDYLGCESKYLFDTFNRLIKETSADGHWETTTYTKAGRIKSKNDSRKNSVEYHYSSDGTYYTDRRNENGFFTRNYYNNVGQLIYAGETLKNYTQYSYNSSGQVLTEKTPQYQISYDYDNLGRCIAKRMEDKDGILVLEKSIVYEDKKYMAAVTTGGTDYVSIKYDVWDNVIEKTNHAGKTVYSYDGLGRLCSEKNQKNQITSYEYDALGNCSVVKYPDETVRLFKRNSLGAIIEEIQNDIKVTSSAYDYDKRNVTVMDELGNVNKTFWNAAGKISSIEDMHYGKVKYSWETNRLVESNLNNENYIFDYDNNGKLIEESNYSGEKTVYKYDKYNRMISKIVNNADNTTITYSENSTNTKSGNDELLIEKNILGLITRVKNLSSDISYEYNTAGKLIYVHDNNAQLGIEYSYDKYGRIINKKSKNFDFYYEYDKVGCIEKIEDLYTNNTVYFDYDKRGNEIYRKYSNGVEVFQNYDSMNRLESKVYKNFYGEIISAEFIVRNNDGKIILSGDKNGEWRRYSYNKNGRLEKIEYPFTDEMSGFYYKEYIESGAYVKERVAAEKKSSLSHTEMTLLKNIISSAGVDYVVNLKESMYSWCENIAYDNRGNVIETENPYGKLYYQYDSMNRLVAKNSDISKTNGINFEWDKYGNLKNIDSQFYRIEYTYNANNRPETIVYKDFRTQETRVLQTKYDGLGRRLVERENNGTWYKYFYDGFSNDVIYSTPVFENDTAVSNYVYEHENFQSHGDEYKWIDDTGYSINSSVKGDVYGMPSEKSKKTASIYLNYRSEPLCIVEMDAAYYNGKKSDYLLSDYQGNCSGIYNSETGFLKNIYDVWGNAISFSEKISYSNSIVAFDAGFTHYDLGYRTYCPKMKSFTTQDPERYGSNWYSYCSGDVVNYKDSSGCRIVPVGLTYLMTDYATSIKLGNSKTETVSGAGCYVTTLANVAVELKKRGVTTNSDYDDPLKINDHKELFLEGDENGGLLKKKASMDAVTGGNAHDYWTRDVSSKYVLQAQLAKAEAIKSECIVVGVFDLSSVSSSATNHMVAINSNFNDEGFLENETDITASSKNDVKRLNDGQLSAYSLDNLKEIRVIETGNTVCNK